MVASVREDRGPRDQARHIIVNTLRRTGYLPGDATKAPR